MGERQIGTKDAVKAYHDSLSKSGLQPARSQEEDLQVTDPILQPEAE